MRVAIITFVCSAQFFDIFNACASIATLPSIGEDLAFQPGVLQWVLAAYTLTFGAFQVPAGRLSDLYHPKPIFVLGYLAVGVFSILCGASVHPIMLIVFRAISGIGAAMTVPTAIAMIVHHFPDPQEQSRILGIYGAFGAVGNAVGFVLGGVLAARASWRWVFYLIGILTIPFAALSYFCLPRADVGEREKRSIDIPGVSILTGGLVLFVFAVSDGSASGWGSPQIITTLVLSVVFFVAFFIVERISKDPALPPRTWSNKNFTPMFFYAWSVYWFLNSAELQLTQIFQDLFHWSALSAAVHFIPLGVAGGTAAWATGMWGHFVNRRILLVGGQLFMATSAILLAFADRPSRYWSFIFPAMILGMLGLATSYVAASVVIMSGVRTGEEGVVGAVLYTTFQVGATVGVAVVTAIQLGVEDKLGASLGEGMKYVGYKGYEASFWSLVGMNGLMIIISLFFVRD
ncbi:major facilitator superfamily domain-containing protein [Abortiporus biennis]|nr:major facilitator superfamily domain-containing protein [Abortiporus biennis]